MYIFVIAGPAGNQKIGEAHTIIVFSDGDHIEFENKVSCIAI